MSDSSTGGYLQPSPRYQSLPGGLSFKQFIQQVFVGVSGLDGELVRPKWQINAPKQPDLTVNWIALALTVNKADANAFIGESLGTQATGFIHFKCNPQPLNTVTINGVVITFVATSPTGSQVLIGEDAKATTQNLLDFLNASVAAEILEATYSAFYQQVDITAAEVGTDENAFTLVSGSSAIILSGDTLSGGSLSNNTTQRHEELEVQCSFYGPDADQLASMVRDGFWLPQNLEVLRSARMGFIGVNDMMHVPDLLNERWVDRYEMSFFFRRQIIRTYPILSFTSVSGSIQSVIDGNLKTIAWSSNT